MKKNQAEDLYRGRKERNAWKTARMPEKKHRPIKNIRRTAVRWKARRGTRWQKLTGFVITPASSWFVILNVTKSVYSASLYRLVFVCSWSWKSVWPLSAENFVFHCKTPCVHTGSYSVCGKTSKNAWWWRRNLAPKLSAKRKIGYGGRACGLSGKPSARFLIMSRRSSALSYWSAWSIKIPISSLRWKWNIMIKSSVILQKNQILTNRKKSCKAVLFMRSISPLWIRFQNIHWK